MTNSAPRPIKLVFLVVYYLLILLVVFAFYSGGAFKTPTFIYQGF